MLRAVTPSYHSATLFGPARRWPKQEITRGFAPVTEVTRSQLIHRGIRQVGQSKIFIDKAAIRRWAEKNLKEDHNRLQAYLRVGIGIDAAAINAALLDALEGKPIPAQMLAVPKNDAMDLLTKIVASLFRECSSNPEHGLDCYLSMRMRHGTLSGQLRTALELEHLITKRSSADEAYAPNEYWCTHLAASLPYDVLKQLDVRLAQFSSEYDAFIAQISNELIQIRSNEKTSGLFGIEINSVNFMLFSSALSKDQGLDQFLDVCFELFWGSVDVCLLAVRTMVNVQLKPTATTLFDKLEEDVAAIAGPARPELTRAIRSAKTGAHQALDIVADWFRLPTPIAQPVFRIEDMIDVGLHCVTTIYREFNPTVIKRVPNLPPFAAALTLFSDLFFIIFDNIRRHSGVPTSPNVEIVIDDLDDRLRIRIWSQLQDDVDLDNVEARLVAIRERIATGEYQGVVASEGGTGLIKLHKIIVGHERRGTRLDFGVDKERFLVDLELAIRGVST